MAAPDTVDLEYRYWLIRCAPEQIPGGWHPVVTVWRPGRDKSRVLGDRVPCNDVFDDREHACTAGLAAGKDWVDARSPDAGRGVPRPASR